MEAAITVLVSSRLSLHLQDRAPQTLSAQIPHETTMDCPSRQFKNSQEKRFVRSFSRIFLCHFHAIDDMYRPGVSAL
jgi:hypothetical protein